MADQDTTIPVMDDRELFENATANEPVQEEAQAEAQEAPEPKVDATGRLHGERGQFVAKPKDDTPAAATQQPEAEQQPAPDDDNAAQVPSWRLREVREAREAAERRAEEASRQAYAFQHQMQEMQRQLAELRKPKAEPIDFFQDPEAAINQRLSPQQERMDQIERKLILNSSRAMALAMHGREAVQEMETAVDKAARENHPDMSLLAQQMRASDDPVQIAMQWHQRTKLMTETGGDLNAYATKLQEKLLADPEFLAKAVAKATGQAQAAAAQPGTRPNVQLPPSLNKATGAGNSPDADGDMSDRALFAYATAKRR